MPETNVPTILLSVFVAVVSRDFYASVGKPAKSCATKSRRILAVRRTKGERGGRNEAKLKINPSTNSVARFIPTLLSDTNNTRRIAVVFTVVVASSRRVSQTDLSNSFLALQRAHFSCAAVFDIKYDRVISTS